MKKIENVTFLLKHLSSFSKGGVNIKMELNAKGQKTFMIIEKIINKI